MFDEVLAKSLTSALKRRIGNVPVRPPVSFTAKCIAMSQDYIKGVPIIGILDDNVPMLAMLADDNEKTQAAFEEWFDKCLALRGHYDTSKSD